MRRTNIAAAETRSHNVKGINGIKSPSPPLPTKTKKCQNFNEGLEENLFGKFRPKNKNIIYNKKLLFFSGFMKYLFLSDFALFCYFKFKLADVKTF